MRMKILMNINLCLKTSKNQNKLRYDINTFLLLLCRMTFTMNIKQTHFIIFYVFAWLFIFYIIIMIIEILTKNKMLYNSILN